MTALRRDFLPEHLNADLTANHIGGCVAIQADQTELETMFLLELAREHKFILGVVGWVDLRSELLLARLEYFSQFPALRGFRHIAQAESDDRFLARPDFLRGISRLRQFGFTYDILIYPRQLPAAVELVSRFPAQKFALDHIAKPKIKAKEIAEWERDLRRLAAHRNVECKLSGMVTEADWKAWRSADFRPYLDVVFDCFGTDRLMFGSDWPVCLLAGNYAQVKNLICEYTANLPQREKEEIFGGNAARFYGLAP